MNDLTGRTIGPYELRDRIGTGGMAAVYLGVHRALGQPRAIKILLPAHTADPTLVERFRSEAKLAAGLQHPNIVSIYDVGEEGGLLYFVMDLVDGVPLGRLMERQQPMPLERAVQLLRQLGSALDYAHARGVIHRDVKTSNVLIGPDDHLTLFDFGIARGANVGRLTKPGLMVGTPYYLAPEVITGAEGDRRVDLYALGVLAYELLTGRLPFVGADTMAVLYAQVNTPPPSLRSSNPEITETIERVVMRELAKRPDDRYPTANGFVSALSAAARLARPPQRSAPTPGPAPTPSTAPSDGRSAPPLSASVLFKPAAAPAPQVAPAPQGAQASHGASAASASAPNAAPSAPSRTPTPPAPAPSAPPSNYPPASRPPASDSPPDAVLTPPTMQRPGLLVPPRSLAAPVPPVATSAPPSSTPAPFSSPAPAPQALVPQTRPPSSPTARAGDQSQSSVAHVLARSPRAGPEAGPSSGSGGRPGALAMPRPRRRPAALILAGLLVLGVIVAGLLAIRQLGPVIGAAPTATTVAAVPPATATAPLAAPTVAPSTGTRAAATVAAPIAAGPLPPTAAPAQAVAATSVPARPAGQGNLQAAPTNLPVPPNSPPVPTTVVAISEPSTPAPEQQMGAALAAIDRGDFTSALAQLGALNEVAPSTDGLADAFYRAHLGYGQQLLDQGQLDESDAQFGEALTIHPGDEAAQDGQEQVVLGKLWRTMEGAWDNDEAVATAALEEILARDPGYRDADAKLYALLITRADRLIAAGDKDGAIEALQRAEAVYPEGGEAEARLAALIPPTAAPASDASGQPAAPPAAAPRPAPAAKPAVRPAVRPPAGLPGIPGIRGR